MRKLLLFLLCLGLVGGVEIVRAQEESDDEAPGYQKISEMGYRNVVILAEGIDTKTAFNYATSYRAAVWYKTSPLTPDIPEPSLARKDLIGELVSINAIGGEWKFIIPKIAEGYFLTTLKYMDEGSLSDVEGMLYLPDSSKNKLMEDEVKRVSRENLVVIYGQ